MIDILVADDHPVIRRGITDILQDQADMRIVGEASNASELTHLLHSGDCNFLILDITLPGRGGLDVLSELRKERPKLPVLVLSMHPEDQFGLRVLRLGASGYMTKETASAELIKAIRQVSSGKKYITPNLAERLAADLDRESDKPAHELLSDREIQVLQMIASGKMIKEIAAELSLSIKTISTYRTRLLQKMKMKTNAELTIYALENQLVQSAQARLSFKNAADA